jgi:hypothetical protein
MTGDEILAATEKGSTLHGMEPFETQKLTLTSISMVT